MKHRRVFHGVLSMGYSSVAVAAIQLAMVPALAGAWGLPTYGQWLLLATVPSFLAASDLGFGYAAGNRLIGEVARGEVDEARTTFQSAQVFVLISSAAIYLLVLAISLLLPARLLSVTGGMDAETARTVLMVLGAYGVVSIQSALFIAVMRAHGAFALSTTFQTTVQLVEGLAVIAVALSGHSPLHAAFAYLIVRSMGVAGHVALATRRAGWLTLGFTDASKSRVLELWRPALAAMLMPLARSGFLQGSTIAVGAAADAAAVPIFTSLRTLSRVGLSFIFAFNKPILPEFTAEHARGNVIWLRKVTGAAITFNGLVGILAAIGLSTLGNSLLAWWTNGAIVAPTSMIYLTAAALLAGCIWEPMSVFLLSINRHEGFTYVFAAVAGLAVCLTYVFVRHWGISGAAGAGLLLESTMVCCVLIPLVRAVGAFRVGPATLWILVPAKWRRKLPKRPDPDQGNGGVES